MAARKRKQVRKYKFELTRASIGGIGVVCFCIFLWMFLLGVWTGQSLLMPSAIDMAEEMDDETSEQVVNLSSQKKNRPD